MKSLFSASAVIFVYMLFALSSCSTQDDMAAKPAPPAPVAKAEKAPPEKAEKATGEKARKKRRRLRWPVMLDCSISKRTT